MPETMTALMEINTFANHCGFFFNAYLDPDTQSSANNGYNCRHPDCDRVEDGVGCCHTWSCPLGYEADEEDCAAFGVEHEESEYIVVDIAPEDFNEARMWKKQGGSE